MNLASLMVDERSAFLLLKQFIVFLEFLRTIQFLEFTRNKVVYNLPYFNLLHPSTKFYVGPNVTFFLDLSFES